jgi:integrase
VLEGISGWWRTPLGGNTGGNGATVSKLPLERTGAPGVYRRGSKYVVVYRVEGRQRKQYADTLELAATLRAHRPREAVDDAFVFPGRDGGASDQGSLRRRVLIPAAERAGLTGVGFHTLRHTCASMLIESGLSPLRLQRWMGHHSPAFTLDTYGHLIDGDLGPGLDLRKELASAERKSTPRNVRGK